MKRILLGASLIALIASCGSETAEVGKLIAEKDSLKNVYSEISKRMTELDDLIASMDSTFKVKKTLVSTMVVMPGDFEHYFEVQGVVDADQSVDINVEMPGKVKNVYVKEGQEVAKGQKLLSIDNNEMQGQYNSAKAQFDLAETTFERVDKLWKKRIGSEIDYLAAKARLETAKQIMNSALDVLMKGMVSAPSNGIIDQIMVKKGEMASGMKPVIRLVNTDDAYLVADLSEKYITSVKNGNYAKINFSLLDDNWYEGEVIATGNYINPGNRTFRINVNVDSKGFQMKPNMLAVIRVMDLKADSTIVLPEKAILEDSKGASYVFVNDAGIAKKVSIETGLSYRGETMVTTGLNKGDNVIVLGARSLKDGEKINIKN
ncbi:MAG: efflux RND transporter periplasmic adaptor subunit [Flavobacteriales bacterium]|nr:efflux RND transporter periplasmic adaptor subunit [Flavobacteriales bacterium]